MKCPHCGKTLKPHKDFRLGFRELSPKQRQTSIAGTTSGINKMKKVHKEMKPKR